MGNEVGGGLADPDIRHSVRTVDPEMKHIHCNLELSVQITNDSDANVELFQQLWKTMVFCIRLQRIAKRLRCILSVLPGAR